MSGIFCVQGVTGTPIEKNFVKGLGSLGSINVIDSRVFTINNVGRVLTSNLFNLVILGLVGNGIFNVFNVNKFNFAIK